MARSDYHFDGPPAALSRLRGRLIAFGFGAVALFVVILAVAGSGIRAAAPFWLALVAPLPLLVLGAALTVRTIKREFPQARNPEGIDQKTLPPLPGATGPYTLPVRERKIGVSALAAMGLIPIVMTVACLALWTREGSLLPVIVGVVLVAGWVIVTAIQGGLSMVDGDRAQLRVDDKGVSFPKFLLSETSKRHLRRDGGSQLFLRWSDIDAWIVAAGGSDDYASYRIRVRHRGEEREHAIRRGLLKGREHELLDAVRRTGRVPVVLRDSADH